MKIVGYLHSCPPMRTVGGEMMTLRLLNHSAEQGHDVVIIVRELENDRMYGKVQLLAGHPASHQPILRALNNADVIVTHPEIADGPFRYTTRIMHTPLVGIVHNLRKRTMHGLRTRPAMHVVANSYYTAELLYETEDLGDRDPTIIHPPTRPPSPPVDGLPRAFCTVVNLSAAKGSAMLRKLVRELPEVQFLAVLGGHGDQEVPKNDNNNVTLYGHFAGLGLPFGLTRVLIAPSLDETYGMTVAEATALGIPVVASDIPAHREALGPSATYVDPRDTEGWIDAVRPLMTDDDAWQVAHERAPAYGDELAAREVQTFAEWDALLDRLSTDANDQ